MFLEACLYSPMHAQSEEVLSTEIIRYTSQPQIYYQHLKKKNNLICGRKKNFKPPEVPGEEIFSLHKPANFKTLFKATFAKGRYFKGSTKQSYQDF